MKKVLLTVSLFTTLTGCVTKTRTITPHNIVAADSNRTITIKEKVAQLFSGVNLVSHCTDKLRSGKLDSAQLSAVADSIIIGVNEMTIGLQPIQDTVYTKN